MKKKSFKSLKLNKRVITTLNALRGGADTSNTGTHLTADVRDCPDNTLADGCMSLGFCTKEASGCPHCPDD